MLKRLSLAISLAATFVNADGDGEIKIPDVSSEPTAQTPEMLDDTRIATCIANKQDTSYIHEWDLEFEGYTSLGQHEMAH